MVKTFDWLAPIAALSLVLVWPAGRKVEPKDCRKGVRDMLANELEEFPAIAPSEPLGLVFLHHSIGSQLLATQGPDDGKGGTHPNGGGLRGLLEQNNYRVHEATYGSQLGEHTDLLDWLPKFSEHMDEVLRIDRQDQVLPPGERNRVVMFKSCFPNNYFKADEKGRTNPLGPTLTLANAEASFQELLPVFRAQPDTLFVFLTTPPLLERVDEGLAKAAFRKLLGRPTAQEELESFGRRSRAFRDWALAPDGWLSGYELRNVAVFDLFGVLTDHGASSFLRYGSLEGRDPHPNSVGNQKVAHALVAFLNRAVHRAFPEEDRLEQGAAGPRLGHLPNAQPATLSRLRAR